MSVAQGQIDRVRSRIADAPLSRTEQLLLELLEVAVETRDALRDIAMRSSAGADPDRLLTIEEVAELLGSVSDDTVRARMAERIDPLPYVLVGGRRLVERRALQAWIERRKAAA